MLTVKFLDNEELKEKVIRQGLFLDREDQLCKFVATRGKIHDWAIYYLPSNHSYESVREIGTKLRDQEIILMLVPCDNEAFKLYRY